MKEHCGPRLQSKKLFATPRGTPEEFTPAVVAKSLSPKSTKGSDGNEAPPVACVSRPLAPVNCPDALLAPAPLLADGWLVITERLELRMSHCNSCASNNRDWSAKWCKLDSDRSMCERGWCKPCWIVKEMADRTELVFRQRQKAVDANVQQFLEKAKESEAEMERAEAAEKGYTRHLEGSAATPGQLTDDGGGDTEGREIMVPLRQMELGRDEVKTGEDVGPPRTWVVTPLAWSCEFCKLKFYDAKIKHDDPVRKWVEPQPCRECGEPMTTWLDRDHPNTIFKPTGSVPSPREQANKPHRTRGEQPGPGVLNPEPVKRSLSRLVHLTLLMMMPPVLTVCRQLGPP